MVVDLMSRGFAYTQDEGGGGGSSASDAGGGEQGGAGQDGAAGAGATHPNYEKLQAEYTRSRQEIGELKGRLDELSRAANAPRQTEPAPRAPEQPATPEPDWEARYRALDPDSDTFKDDLANLRKEERVWQDRKSERALADVENRVTARMTAGERRQAIEASNSELFERMLNDKERVPVRLSPAEIAALREDFNNHVGPEYGVFDASARAFRRNERAFEAALYAVPQVRQKLLAFHKASGRDEGLRARAAGAAAGSALPSGQGSASPPKNASTEEVARWLQQQPPNVRHEFVKNNKEFRANYLRQRDQERRAAAGL